MEKLRGNFTSILILIFLTTSCYSKKEELKKGIQVKSKIVLKSKCLNFCTYLELEIINHSSKDIYFPKLSKSNILSIKTKNGADIREQVFDFELDNRDNNLHVNNYDYPGQESIEKNKSIYYPILTSNSNHSKNIRNIVLNDENLEFDFTGDEDDQLIWDIFQTKYGALGFLPAKGSAYIIIDLNYFNNQKNLENYLKNEIIFSIDYMSVLSNNYSKVIPNDSSIIDSVLINNKFPTKILNQYELGNNLQMKNLNPVIVKY